MASDRLILGLGNPGDRYARTRHNLGFRVVSELARRRDLGPPRLECNALVTETDGLILAAPQTYMNRSGYAARCLVEKRDLESGDLLVVYDEVSLPLGKMRFRPQGGPGGHRGMESVIQNLRTEEVPRLRLGIVGEGGAPPAEALADYVLMPFDREEEEVVEEMIVRAADACDCWLSESDDVVMNRFNR